MMKEMKTSKEYKVCIDKLGEFFTKLYSEGVRA
jgi:hypothetical protein